MASLRLRASSVRLYRTVRTAHLERAIADSEHAPVAIVHRAKRYDFAEDVAAQVELVQAGPLKSAALIARSRPDLLEVNEPLMLDSLVGTAITIALLRVRQFRASRRTIIASYAIGNSDPFAAPPPVGARGRLRRRVDRHLSGVVWRSLDRVVFGTRAAQRTYEECLGALRRGARSTLIPALSAPCACVDEVQDRASRVIFVGALTRRKGFDLLLEAWDQVASALPEATLVVLGKGELESRALDRGQRDPSVTVEIDPSRTRIHNALASARVLVLPSQPTPMWREQVGLPILEGLQHGCRVVATTETGIADWLCDHGHRVLPVPTDAGALAEAIVAALSEGPEADCIRSSLPSVDGRLAADRWLRADVRP